MKTILPCMPYNFFWNFGLTTVKSKDEYCLNLCNRGFIVICLSIIETLMN